MFTNAMYPYGSGWNGSVRGWQWAAPANYGSSQFLFIEDNTFTCTRTTTSGNAHRRFQRRTIRCSAQRHQQLRNGITALKSPGRGRSSRAMEIYNNQIDCNNVNRYVSGDRGGGELFHDNTITNCGGASTLATLSAFRMIASFFQWGRRGRNEWMGQEQSR